MKKYEIDFNPGEDDRLPEWNVYELQSELNGVRVFKKVFTSYDLESGEEECKDYMNYLLDMEMGYLV